MGLKISGFYFINPIGMLKAGRMNFRDFELPVPPDYKDYIEEQKEFKMGIRPESFHISKNEKKDHFLFHCVDIQEKGEGVRILYLQSKEKYNELKAVGTFPNIEAGQKVWLQFPTDKVRIYDKKRTNRSLYKKSLITLSIFLMSQLYR